MICGGKMHDFCSNDVLSSYSDETRHLDPTANGRRLDLSAEDFHDSRVRSPLALFGQPEKFSQEEVISAVEKCMEKYTDNIMMYLEGISGRLIQLELYCYKLERSISEFRTDMIHDHSEGDLKLKSLEKHVYEVHRSIQIMKDKQELFEIQKDLSKLQVSQNSTNTTPQSYENKSCENPGDLSNPQFVLSLPPLVPDQNHPYKEQPLPQSSPLPLTTSPQHHYLLNHANSFYYTHHQPLLQPLQSPSHSSQDRDPRLQIPPAYTSYALLQHADTIPQISQGPFVPPTFVNSGYVGTSMLGNPVYFIGGSRSSHLQDGSCSPNGNVAGAPANSSDHSFGDMVEKAVGMGFPRDQVVGALGRIRIAETGQPLGPKSFP